MTDIKSNIEKLMSDESISNYAINKETGIAQSTLSDLKKGVTKLGTMKLDHAIKLNDFYLKIKE